MQKTEYQDEILVRILETMKKRGIRQKELTTYLGITETAFTKWKFKGSISYVKYIDRIAEFLHVPANYLLYGTIEDPHSKQISFEDIELVNAISELTDSEKEFIRTTIAFFQNQHLTNNPLR